MSQGSFSFKATRWTLDLAKNFLKADVRVHNAEKLQADMAIVYVVNHFTRMETILLPYELHKATGRETWSLASGELFFGRIGQYLRSMGTVSTQDPDRDKTIVHSLLNGQHPWIIYPEGQMIKDKKVVDPLGNYEVYNKGVRRPPHTGAAVLALRAEYYRHKFECLKERPNADPEELNTVLKKFNLSSVDHAIGKKTVIIPVNVTYYPIRARENFLYRFARGMVKDLSPRAIEELSVEGTMLSRATNIDITLGDPIYVRDYLEAPEYAELMTCGIGDMTRLEEDPGSAFNDAARRIMLRYMQDIYDQTTINYDHIFASIIRFQDDRVFTERAYRNRIYLAARQIQKLGKYRLHTLLDRTHPSIVYEDPSPKFEDFLNLCLEEKILVSKDGGFQKDPNHTPEPTDFHIIRQKELTSVIANEIEPLPDLVSLIKTLAVAPRGELSRTIREIFVEEDNNLFETDYDDWHKEDSKPREIGRPFLLQPRNPRAGIVLVHGYLSAPEEMRAMAEYFYARDYAVYGVRLAGHGTSPEDLATRHWEEWYDSLNRGYVAIKSLTDRIVLGGFSTGGCLALLGAARKGQKVEAVFCINAPVQLRNYKARLAPTIVGMNTLLKKMGKKVEQWEFVENFPENKHINYLRNPLHGVSELDKIMAATEAVLKDVKSPTLITQASDDPIVHPDSARTIFDGLGCMEKELVMFRRDRHGIVNGPGANEVFSRVSRFLEWALEREERFVAAPEINPVLERAEPTNGQRAPKLIPAIEGRVEPEDGLRLEGALGRAAGGLAPDALGDALAEPMGMESQPA